MKAFRYLAMAVVAVMATALWSCSDDNSLTPLGSTDMTTEDVTYNSLTFRWQKVADARQYSYQLSKTGTDNILETGVTKNTSVTFNGLDYDTEYTLTVLAYAAMGSGNTTSAPIVLNARTADLTTLPSPVLTWEREVNTIIVSWEAVSGARQYDYTLTDADGNQLVSSSTYNTYAEFPDLATGRYTIAVTAVTETEGCRNSAPATVEIDFVREHQEVWRVSGTYTSALLGTTWQAVLVAYDDNAYQLLGWYGVDGYNLDFSIDQSDADNMFHLADTYTYNSSTDSYSVPTGLTNPARVIVYSSGNRSAMEGNSGKGSVTIAVSNGSATGTDTFKWGITIDDFLGIWNLDFAGYDLYDSAYDETYQAQVEITKGTAANTLIVPMPQYYGYICDPGTMVVDLESMTFTMQPVPFGYGNFVFSSPTSSTTPMSGRLSSNSIVFNGIQSWYSGYDYLASNSYLKYTR